MKGAGDGFDRGSGKRRKMKVGEAEAPVLRSTMDHGSTGKRKVGEVAVPVLRSTMDHKSTGKRKVYVSMGKGREDDSRDDGKLSQGVSSGKGNEFKAHEKYQMGQFVASRCVLWDNDRFKIGRHFWEYR